MTERLTQSYDYAADLTRREAKNFYHGFRFLTPERRRGIYAVYAYSRRLDDAVDAVEEKSVSPDAARRDLAHLRSFLEDSAPDDILVPALQDTIERYGIATRHFEELIAGMEMDLEIRRYATFPDLYRYCYRAASAVGLVCIEIFGYQGKPVSGANGTGEPAEHATGPTADVADPAEALGIAMQLTNIIRDVAEDLGRDRIYLPLEDLARFEYSEDDLRDRIIDDRFRALMRFQVERAREYFHKAEPLYALVVPESRFCPVLLGRFYSRILDRIEHRGFDVLSRRPSLPKYEKLKLFAKTWLEARRGKAAVTSPE